MDPLNIVLLVTTILSFIANVIQAIFHVPPKCNSSCFNCCDESIRQNNDDDNPTPVSNPNNDDDNPTSSQKT